MDSNFLTDKGPGGIPNWLIGVGGIGVAIIIGAYRKKAAATAASTATNPATQASQTPPNVFVVPGATTTAPGQVPPAVGRGDSPPDLLNSSGKDIGTYRFGTDQLTYLTTNKGSFGISDQIISDVQKAYAQISQQKGQGQAEMYHYSWLGKGNVQAIPRYANSANDIVMNLP